MDNENLRLLQAIKDNLRLTSKLIFNPEIIKDEQVRVGSGWEPLDKKILDKKEQNLEKQLEKDDFSGAGYFEDGTR